jgi:hypothetical protein
VNCGDRRDAVIDRHRAHGPQGEGRPHTRKVTLRCAYEETHAA